MELDIVELIKDYPQINRIDILHKSIRKSCMKYIFDTSSPYKEIYERINNTAFTLILNVARMMRKKETTIELVGSNLSIDDIENILIFICRELHKVLFPKEKQNNIFKHLKEYHIYPYFLMRTNKQEYEIFGY